MGGVREMNVDHETHAKLFGQVAKGADPGLVLAELQPPDDRLGHAQLSGECGLGEPMLGPVLDHLVGNRPGKGCALPLLAKLEFLKLLLQKVL